MTIEPTVVSVIVRSGADALSLAPPTRAKGPRIGGVGKMGEVSSPR